MTGARAGKNFSPYRAVQRPRDRVAARFGDGVPRPDGVLTGPGDVATVARIRRPGASMHGIVAYGVYVPHYRIERQTIGEALGVSAGKGSRAVASYDEDATSMGVEAARAALRGAPGVAPGAVYFATASPPYLDKTNAT